MVMCKRSNSTLFHCFFISLIVNFTNIKHLLLYANSQKNTLLLDFSCMHFHFYLSFFQLNLCMLYCKSYTIFQYVMLFNIQKFKLYCSQNSLVEYNLMVCLCFLCVNVCKTSKYTFTTTKAPVSKKNIVAITCMKIVVYNENANVSVCKMKKKNTVLSFKT